MGRLGVGQRSLRNSAAAPRAAGSATRRGRPLPLTRRRRCPGDRGPARGSGRPAPEGRRLRPDGSAPPSRKARSNFRIFRCGLVGSLPGTSLGTPLAACCLRPRRPGGPRIRARRNGSVGRIFGLSCQPSWSGGPPLRETGYPRQVLLVSAPHWRRPPGSCCTWPVVLRPQRPKAAGARGSALT